MNAILEMVGHTTAIDINLMLFLGKYLLLLC